MKYQPTASDRGEKGPQTRYVAFGNPDKPIDKGHVCSSRWIRHTCPTVVCLPPGRRFLRPHRPPLWHRSGPRSPPSSCPRPFPVQHVMKRSRVFNSQRSGQTPSVPRWPAHAIVNNEDTAPFFPLIVILRADPGPFFIFFAARISRRFPCSS